MKGVSILNWEEFQKSINSVDKEFDRIEYYKEYYQNLSPSEFEVQKEGEWIKIKIPSKE